MSRVIPYSVAPGNRNEDGMVSGKMKPGGPNIDGATLRNVEAAIHRGG